jgi:hypothetical protein
MSSLKKIHVWRFGLHFLDFYITGGCILEKTANQIILNKTVNSNCRYHKVSRVRIGVKVSGLEQLGEEALNADRDQTVNRFFGTRSKFFAHDPFGHQNFSETI